MPKRRTKPPLHAWAIYLLKATPAKFVGIVETNPTSSQPSRL